MFVYFENTQKPTPILDELGSIAVIHKAVETF
jgi:hypothetical protein